ncbi:hypothetical protein GcC1_105002 [Golovinomyces cichoracearum]|uniref:Uncharacterized protein n=1 Tax=Golovinomyces cichoracearum TaxID=62708 RepID=A0A420I9H4_9PEZI|nr:hypothetical protein GcC1_105002 [Golovinomyces cichoracearum]
MLFEDEMSYIEENDPTTSKPQIPLKASCHNLDLHICNSQDGTTTIDDDKITLVEKSMPGTPPKLKSKKYQESIVDLLSLLAESAENSRKRVRIDDMLNDEHHFQSTSRISGKKKKGEAKIQELREIVGHRGKGPEDYVKLAEEIKVPINLPDLFQISPDLVKNFKKISTRTNQKQKEKERQTGTTKRANLLETEKTIPLNSFPVVDVDNKAFRIPTIVRIKKDGKYQRVRLPQCASQAD